MDSETLRVLDQGSPKDIKLFLGITCDANFHIKSVFTKNPFIRNTKKNPSLMVSILRESALHFNVEECSIFMMNINYKQVSPLENRDEVLYTVAVCTP